MPDSALVAAGVTVDELEFEEDVGVAPAPAPAKHHWRTNAAYDESDGSTRGLVTPPPVLAFPLAPVFAEEVWKDARAGMSMLSPKLVPICVGVGVELEVLVGEPFPAVLGGLRLPAGLAFPLPTGEPSAERGGLSSPPPAYFMPAPKPRSNPSPGAAHAKPVSGDSGPLMDGDEGVIVEGVESALESAVLGDSASSCSASCGTPCAPSLRCAGTGRLLLLRGWLSGGVLGGVIVPVPVATLSCVGELETGDEASVEVGEADLVSPPNTEAAVEGAKGDNGEEAGEGVAGFA